MKITLTFTNAQQSEDFQLNDDLVIQDALEIISKNTDFYIDNQNQYIYSKRKKEKISIRSSFQGARIYSGDELIVEG